LNDSRQVAFITGASRGIGRGIALELARSRYDIAGNSRALDRNNLVDGIFEVKQAVESLGGRFLPVQGDVSNLEDHERMIQEALREFGQVDLLVNNAGVAPEQRVDVLQTTPESFDRVLSTNSRGPFFLTQLVARQMIEQIQHRGKLDKESRPKIVFVTSISAYISSSSRVEYCMSKSALSMAASVFADRLAEYGINVYEVRPGIIKTEMTAGVVEKYDRLIEEGLVPQQRWGLPEDVGKAVCALVSGAFEYSTGAVIEVSGGMNIRRL